MFFEKRQISPHFSFLVPRRETEYVQKMNIERGLRLFIVCHHFIQVYNIERRSVQLTIKITQLIFKPQGCFIC